MRALVLVLIGCSGAMPEVDAGFDGGVDAGRDAGVEACSDDGGMRDVWLFHVSDQLGAACVRPECSARSSLPPARICRLRGIYADAGCVWSDDGGQVDIDCRALCGTAVGPPTCCARMPPGVATQQCGWTPP